MVRKAPDPPMNRRSSLRRCVAAPRPAALHAFLPNRLHARLSGPVSRHFVSPLSLYPLGCFAHSWEPRTEEKGLIARAMFYMATRYSPSAAQYPFGKLTTLLDWHLQFPPQTPSAPATKSSTRCELRTLPAPLLARVLRVGLRADALSRIVRVQSPPSTATRVLPSWVVP